MALADPVMGKWSQGLIAEACVVSHQYVNLVDQRQHCNDGNVGVEGKDGKSYPAKKAAQMYAQKLAGWPTARIAAMFRTTPRTVNREVAGIPERSRARIEQLHRDGLAGGLEC